MVYMTIMYLGSHQQGFSKDWNHQKTISLQYENTFLILINAHESRNILSHTKDAWLLEILRGREEERGGEEGSRESVKLIKLEIP